MTPLGAVVTPLFYSTLIQRMSLAYTTTNILCAATDVGMHGLLASQSCYHSLVCVALWTSSRFLHY